MANTAEASRITYASAVFGDEEKQAVAEALESNWLAPGPRCREFGAAIGKITGTLYNLFVNSGSSANLLALSLVPPGEVITPACTFATTYAPILQTGHEPVVIDVDLDQSSYLGNLDQVNEALSLETTAIMYPLLLGNVPNFDEFNEILRPRDDLVIILDACDTLGAQYGGDPIGKYADYVTSSFYGSHHITAAGSGGMFGCKKQNDLELARTLRDWGRAGTDDESLENRAAFIDGLSYDAKFTYLERGYNFRPNELMAAFGLAQLNRLPEFLVKRITNFARLYEFFGSYKEYLILPHSSRLIGAQWLAFPLTVRDNAPFTRDELMAWYENHGVQTRLIMAGNILKHPAYRGTAARTISDLENSNLVMRGGLLLGIHPGLAKSDLGRMCGLFERFVERHG